MHTSNLYQSMIIRHSQRPSCYFSFIDGSPIQKSWVISPTCVWATHASDAWHKQYENGKKIREAAYSEYYHLDAYCIPSNPVVEIMSYQYEIYAKSDKFLRPYCCFIIFCPSENINYKRVLYYTLILYYYIIICLYLLHMP